MSSNDNFVSGLRGWQQVEAVNCFSNQGLHNLHSLTLHNEM